MKTDKVNDLKFGGYSSSKGVAYYSNNYIVGCYYDTSNKVRTIVKREKKNNFDALKNIVPDLEENKEEHKKKKICLLLEAVIIMGIELLLQWFLLKMHLFKTIFIIVQILVVGFIALSVYIFCSKDKRVIYFHGAEHKVRKAFDKFGFVPNIDVIQKQSRYHSMCGVSLPTNVLFLLNVFSFLAIKFNIIMPPLSLIITVGMMLPSINPYSLILQYFVTTKEPTTNELVIAKTAYQRLIELENGYENIRDNEEIASIRREKFHSLYDNDVNFLDNEEFICKTNDKDFNKALENEWADILYQEYVEVILFEGIIKK